jgi:hypothetical protein
MSESKQIVQQLLESITETVEQLQQLVDADLDADCSHGCAQNGGVRRLLIHNIEHDRSHAGAISSIRSDAQQLQQSELAFLVRDWLYARVELVAQLLQTPDEVLDLYGPEEEWTVRKHIEHTAFYERETIDVAMTEKTARGTKAASVITTN